MRWSGLGRGVQWHRPTHNGPIVLRSANGLASGPPMVSPIFSIRTVSPLVSPSVRRCHRQSAGVTVGPMVRQMRHIWPIPGLATGLLQCNKTFTFGDNPLISRLVWALTQHWELI